MAVTAAKYHWDSNTVAVCGTYKVDGTEKQLLACTYTASITKIDHTVYFGEGADDFVDEYDCDEENVCTVLDINVVIFDSNNPKPINDEPSNDEHNDDVA